jgi:phosphatidate cytidylyltransferase
MLKRTISSLAILAIGLPVLMIGGIPYFILISFLLVAAAWEYSIMFRAAHHNPSRLVLLGGTFFVTATRAFFPVYSLPALEIFILLALTIHLVSYERGRDSAVIDFGITISGLIYIGWIGSYLLDLRSLSNGAWWVFLALPCVWMADVGAYTIGAAYGRPKSLLALALKNLGKVIGLGYLQRCWPGCFFHLPTILGARLMFLFGRGACSGS